MYFVKYGKEYLHDPRVDGCKLLDLSLDCEENSCGYCDFTIYPDHPLYDKLQERDATNPIEVYDGDVLLFAGFIYELGKEFYLDGHVKCKGELDYLNESIIRPYSTTEKGYGLKAPETPKALFEWYINQHNEQLDPSKQFTIGINQCGANSTSNIAVAESIGYPKTIEEIKTQLIDVFGGYIRIRHKDDVRYIDYLAEWTDTNAQTLEFGVNLTDYTQTDDSENIATFVVPLGAKMSETDYAYDDGYSLTADTVMDQNKIYYTNTYSSVNHLRGFDPGIRYLDKFTVTFVTSDTAVCEGIAYYTRSDEPNDDGEYTYTRQDIPNFVRGVTYYEQEDTYSETTDSTPEYTKTYYILNEDSYSQVSDLGRFLRYETYYEYDENEDESDLPLTIETLLDRRYADPYIKSGDMVYNEDSVRKYGWIGITYSDTDIIIKEDLLDAGVIALKEFVSPKRTIEIKAVDMHLINSDIKPICIGEYVRVKSDPHKLDSYFLCVNINLDLNNPENSIYTLGTTFDTLTGQQNKRINTLNASINQQYQASTTVLDEVKKVANNSVVSVVEEYATSTSSLIIPTTGWTTTVPTETAGQIVWKRIATVYGDGTIIRSTPTALIGNSGRDGIDGVDGVDGADAILLRIDSSRGTVFKNNSIATVLSAVIYKGGTRITDMAALRSAVGAGAYLEWSWQRLDDNAFGVISSSDSMIGNDGFTLTISAAEVDTKVTFMCELKI